VKQAAASAAAAHVAWQQAVEHAPDAMQKANRMQRAARSADVIAVGFDRHRASAWTIGHGHVIAPTGGRGGLNDRVRRRVVAA